MVNETLGIERPTLDTDLRLGPELGGDVSKIPLRTASFDCVLAAEVLEHIPFEIFGLALDELIRVSRRYIIITLPAPLFGDSALISIPQLEPIGFFRRYETAYTAQL